MFGKKKKPAKTLGEKIVDDFFKELSKKPKPMKRGYKHPDHKPIGGKKR